MSKYRGHYIELFQGEWVYSDTKESVKVSYLARNCGICDKPYTDEGHDACLGTLKFVMNACCGHGNINEAYVQFLDGSCVRGKNAVALTEDTKPCTIKAR
ncbi:hypothetical protein LCGC14_1770980 [marine sediment metagenome]|uniref:Uncharacterized protein n=1 Tax=marine sediment metagenome TaxID=412755 RepID=A0A0F9JY16_9ZZZZ